MEYQDFLRSKIKVAERCGFDVDPADINPLLKPHQRDMVRWAVAGGRRALFASFGLGKSVMQLEIVRLIRARVGGRALIVLPLGVRQEFRRDAAMLGLDVKFIRTAAELDDGHWLYLTNYESVRDGKLDPGLFTVASLDEASCLRGLRGHQDFPRVHATVRAGALSVRRDRNPKSQRIHRVARVCCLSRYHGCRTGEDAMVPAQQRTQ